jgi:glycosyltransferase involved in cell wall biosynthesis
MLDSFYAQSLDDLSFELLVIDNRSTDETRAVAEAFTARQGFRYIYEDRQGLSHARNRGLAEARENILAYLDDDVLLSPEWLRAIVSCFDETAADVVGGRSLLRFEKTPPPWFGPEFRKMLSEVDLGEVRRSAGDGRRLYGLNLAYRRSTLESIGGFDTSYGRTGDALLAGEDLRANVAIAAAGGRLFYEPKAVVHHCIPPERCAWEYLLRLAVVGADTRLALDAAAPLPHRARACAEAALKYAAAAAGAAFAARDSYEGRSRKVAMARHRRLARGYFTSLL